MKHKNTSVLFLLILFTCGFLSFSCVTYIPVGSTVEPERLLPSGASLYLKLDSKTLYNALLQLGAMSETDASLMADKTKSLVAAFFMPTAASPGGIMAVATGSYPAAGISMHLSASPDWVRKGAIWEHKTSHLYIAFANDKLFIGTMPIDSFINSAKNPNPYPIPSQWKENWKQPVAMYIPKPIAFIQSFIPLGSDEIPLNAIVMSSVPDKTDYKTKFIFAFDDNKAALVFGPLCRVFIFTLAQSLWPTRSATVIESAVWQKQDNIIEASALPLDAESIASFIKLLK